MSLLTQFIFINKNLLNYRDKFLGLAPLALGSSFFDASLWLLSPFESLHTFFSGAILDARNLEWLAKTCLNFFVLFIFLLLRFEPLCYSFLM